MAKLRCRPGDTCLDLCPGANAGMLVRVMRAARSAEVALFPGKRIHWAIESLGSEFSTIEPDGSKTFAMAVLADDRQLQPLRDRSGADEMLRITGKPKRRKSVA